MNVKELLRRPGIRLDQYTLLGEGFALHMGLAGGSREQGELALCSAKLHLGRSVQLHAMRGAPSATFSRSPREGSGAIFSEEGSILLQKENGTLTLRGYAERFYKENALEAEVTAPLPEEELAALKPDTVRVRLDGQLLEVKAPILLCERRRGPLPTGGKLSRLLCGKPGLLLSLSPEEPENSFLERDGCRIPLGGVRIERVYAGRKEENGPYPRRIAAEGGLTGMFIPWVHQELSHVPGMLGGREHRYFGTFSGSLTLDGEEPILLEALPGWAERLTYGVL